MSTQRWTMVTVGMAAAVFAVLAMIAGIERRPAAPVALTSSPAPTVLGVTATPVAAAGTLTPSPAPTATPAPARTAEEAARQLGAALESSDWERIRALIIPTGWTAAYHEGEATPKLMRREAIAYLRESTPDGRLRVEVSEGPLEACREIHPCTSPAPPEPDVYVRSVWIAFQRIDRQNAHLVLKRDTDGRWYWSGVLFRAP